VIGTGEVRYFVQGLGTRRFDSEDFGSLPDAERYFEDIEATGPKQATGFGWREGLGFL
jgi:hypothetical protein